MQDKYLQEEFTYLFDEEMSTQLMGICNWEFIAWDDTSKTSSNLQITINP